MQDFLLRIQQFADYKGIKITALERQLGASKGVLSRSISNNTDIQCKWLRALVENYPDVNVYWLLTGKEDMLKYTSHQEQTCSHCADKERLIESLKSTISKQDIIIDLLTKQK